MIAALPVAVAFRKQRFDDAIIPDSIVYMIDRRQARDSHRLSIQIQPAFNDINDTGLRCFRNRQINC